MESRSKIGKSDRKAGLSREFDLLRQQEQGKDKMKQIGEESFTKKPQDEELTEEYQDARKNAREVLEEYQDARKNAREVLEEYKKGKLSREEYLVVNKKAIEAFDAWIGRKTSS